MAIYFIKEPFSHGSNVAKVTSGTGTGTSVEVLSANASYGYIILDFLVTTNASDSMIISFYSGSDNDSNRIYYVYDKNAGRAYLNYYPFTPKNEAVYIAFGSSVTYYYTIVYNEKYS